MTELTDAECDALIRQAFPLTKASAAYRKLVRLAARSADTSGARRSADALYDAIMVVLEHHRLSYSVTADDETLPLIDALCSGQPLDVGRDEIVLICDAIYNEVLMPEPPPAAPGGPAGARRPDENSPSGPSDRALNTQPEAVDHDRGA